MNTERVLRTTDMLVQATAALRAAEEANKHIQGIDCGTEDLPAYVIRDLSKKLGEQRLFSTPDRETFEAELEAICDARRITAVATVLLGANRAVVWAEALEVAERVADAVPKDARLCPAAMVQALEQLPRAEVLLTGAWKVRDDMLAALRAAAQGENKVPLGGVL